MQWKLHCLFLLTLYSGVDCGGPLFFLTVVLRK